MRTISRLLLVAVAAALVGRAYADGPAKKSDTRKAPITWKKTIIEKAFRSEGVAVADVNKDGKMDIIVGDVWYEAPEWKVHVIRKDRNFDPKIYSECFGCFADDFNGDGWPDVIVIPFPGAVCHWYENPKGKPGPWKEHALGHSACNETPIYVDLFRTGKKVLVMGVQPIEKLLKGPEGRYEVRTSETRGRMVWLRPGKDPTQLWETQPISDVSKLGKEIPGTRRFDHGLGQGDVNGDGRLDIICTGGWWEQPEKLTSEPWRFHPANLGPACADMFAYDIDGDGKRDIVSSSAHGYGLWWHQQTRSKDDVRQFVRRDLFPPPAALVSLPKDHKLSKEEQTILTLLNKDRIDKQRVAPLIPDARLCQVAHAEAEARAGGNDFDTGAALAKAGYKGKVAPVLTEGDFDSPEAFAKSWLEPTPRPKGNKLPHPEQWSEIGIGWAVSANGRKVVVILQGGSGRFSLFSQSHALHCVDIDGDGLKDLVTGRRWWAHGPKGDPGSGGPALLYWFQAKRDKKGFVTFTPHLIDDDSGIGTQFAIADIDGDGLLDIIVSNKRGVFVFEQRRLERPATPPRKS